MRGLEFWSKLVVFMVVHYCSCRDVELRYDEIETVVLNCCEQPKNKIYNYENVCIFIFLTLLLFYKTTGQICCSFLQNYPDFWRTFIPKSVILTNPDPLITLFRQTLFTFWQRSFNKDLVYAFVKIFSLFIFDFVYISDCYWIFWIFLQKVEKQMNLKLSETH